MKSEKENMEEKLVKREMTSPVCYSDSPEVRPEYLEEADDIPVPKEREVRDKRDRDR